VTVIQIKSFLWLIEFCMVSKISNNLQSLRYAKCNNLHSKTINPLLCMAKESPNEIYALVQTKKENIGFGGKPSL